MNKTIATLDIGKGTTSSRAIRGTTEARALAPEGPPSRKVRITALIIVSVISAACIQAQTRTAMPPTVAPRGCAFMKVADTFTAATTPREFKRTWVNVPPRNMLGRDFRHTGSVLGRLSSEGFLKVPRFMVTETTPVRLPLISPALRHTDSQMDSLVLVCGLHGFDDSK